MEETITVWIDGIDHAVAKDQVVPWLFGLAGGLRSVDVGLGASSPVITVDIDHATGSGPGYLLEVGGERRVLAEAWVLPWMSGLAVHHGCDPRDLCDRSNAERAQQIQALMVGHDRGWLRYEGPVRRSDQVGR